MRCRSGSSGTAHWPKSPYWRTGCRNSQRRTSGCSWCWTSVAEVCLIRTLSTLLNAAQQADWEEKWQSAERRLAEEKQRTEELGKRVKWQEERVAESAAALGAAGRLADQMSAQQAQVVRLQEEGMCACSVSSLPPHGFWSNLIW